MIDAAVFDFDGTLVQSNLIKHDAWYDVGAMVGMSTSEVDQLLDQNPGADRFAICETLARRASGDTVEAATLTARYGEQCELKITACDEVEGASDVITWLREASVPVYLNSATPREALERIVRRRGWGDWFSGVFGRPGDKVTHLKSIIKSGDFRRDRVVMVGDGEDDREAAEQVGCPFVGVRSARHRNLNAFSEPPRTLLDDLRPLRDVLRAI